VTRLIASDATETILVTGMSKLFTPRPAPRVVTLEPVTITAEAPSKGIVLRPEDLPDAEPAHVSSVVRFEDLPLAQPSKGTVIDVNDLPDA
jgi:hypothetical protein